MPGKRTGDDYQVQDLDLLTIVAGQVALQIENSRLYEEELEKRALEEQLVLARSIQSRLLPGRIPAVPGADLAALNISSAQVSGDYYDLIVRPDGCLGLVISDVSGKGVPASLLASSLQASLRAQLDITDSPGAILDRVNRNLHSSTDPQHFATLFLGVYDPASRVLRYSSGGHNAPILRRTDGTVLELEEGGLPLGAFDFARYDEGRIELAPGDLLFLYTDGLTETVDALGEEFGTERVAELLHAHHELAAGELIGRVRDELARFCGRRQADDDVTLIVLKVLATAAAESPAACQAALGEQTD
jgi:sigma-B regulation protein RsbU (phosphoserine phosphatase)